MSKEEESVQYLLFQTVHAYLVRSFGQAAPMGIHPGQIPMLRMLEKEDRMSQMELGKKLGIKPSTVTVSLKRMEKMELVRREPDEKDQRVLRVSLTDKGREIFCDLMQVMRKNEEEMLTGLTETEVCLLKRMLEQIRKNLQQDLQEEMFSEIADRKERQK